MPRIIALSSLFFSSHGASELWAGGVRVGKSPWSLSRRGSRQLRFSICFKISNSSELRLFYFCWRFFGDILKELAWVYTKNPLGSPIFILLCLCHVVVHGCISLCSGSPPSMYEVKFSLI